MKRCGRCKETKPAHEFSRCASRKDGLRYECKSCCTTLSMVWHYDNPERAQAKAKRWNAQNPAKCQAWARAYRAKNPEKAQESVRVSKAKNPEKYRAIRRRLNMTRRAREVKAFVEYIDPKVIHDWYGGICQICHMPVNGQYEIDHIKPLSKGGLHCFDNVQLTCRRCNRKKGAK